jgi:hypothetical protein
MAESSAVVLYELSLWVKCTSLLNSVFPGPTADCWLNMTMLFSEIPMQSQI